MICKYFALLCYSNISSLASIVTFASLAFYQSRAKVDTLWPAAQRARAGKSGNDCFGSCFCSYFYSLPLLPLLLTNQGQKLSLPCGHRTKGQSKAKVDLTLYLNIKLN